MTTAVKTKPIRPIRPVDIKRQLILITLFTLFNFVILSTASPVVINSISSDFDAVEMENAHGDHYRRVLSSTRCGLPKERVVHLRDLMPDPALKFIPECTVLHRCGADAGCCPDGYACGPRMMEDVTLVFKIFQMNPEGLPNITTQAFTFTNHTECACAKNNAE